METPPLIYTVEVYGANTTEGFFFKKKSWYYYEVFVNLTDN